MNLLALETSAKAASCAVYRDGLLAAEFFINAGLTHTETLMPMVKSMLDSVGTPLGEIEAFAVAAGPGSFTGLRIGISAVKGMALPRNLPCVAVSTLEALAYNLSAFDGIAVPLMDARRGQVYTALFRTRGGFVTRLGEDEAIDADAVYKKLKNFTEPVTLVGDGAALHYEKLSRDLPNVSLAPPALLHQRAGSVLFAALQKLAQGGGSPPGELAPVYLRLPQAERERLEKLDQN